MSQKPKSNFKLVEVLLLTGGDGLPSLPQRHPGPGNGASAGGLGSVTNTEGSRWKLGVGYWESHA